MMRLNKKNKHLIWVIKNEIIRINPPNLLPILYNRNNLLSNKSFKKKLILINHTKRFKTKNNK